MLKFFHNATIDYIATVFPEIDVKAFDVSELHEVLSKQNLKVTSELQV